MLGSFDKIKKTTRVKKSGMYKLKAGEKVSPAHRKRTNIAKEPREESVHERLESAKDYQEFRELRDLAIPNHRGMSGKLYGHYSHYRF